MPIPDLSLAISMAPGKTPSFTACSNRSSKDGVMIDVCLDTCKIPFEKQNCTVSDGMNMSTATWFLYGLAR